MVFKKDIETLKKKAADFDAKAKAFQQKADFASYKYHNGMDSKHLNERDKAQAKSDNYSKKAQKCREEIKRTKEKEKTKGKSR